MLNPKLPFFKKPNKKRIRKTYENKSNRIRFGTFGLQALQQGFLTVKQIEAVRRTIASKLKRKGKTWIRAFPDFPRTAKPKEVRMGRGKGNIAEWVAIIKPGRILFEVKSKHKMQIYDALQFSKRKIPFKTRIITNTIKL